MMTAAMIVGLSGTALAQSPATTHPESPDSWFASAYLGSNFGGGNVNNVTNIDIDTGSTASINFGGEIGYAWAGTFGAEFMANHSPNFELSDVLLQRRPSVSTYMVNGLAAVPIGAEHRFRPFVSGGLGGVTLRSTIFTIDPTKTSANINTLGTTTTSGTRFGWDVGGGVMVFNGPWGLRADVRYYRATTDNNSTDNTIEGVFLQRQLSGISFWNSNFGVAFRW
jgi:hypothetical protein